VQLKTKIRKLYKSKHIKITFENEIMILVCSFRANFESTKTS